MAEPPMNPNAAKRPRPGQNSEGSPRGGSPMGGGSRIRPQMQAGATPPPAPSPQPAPQQTTGQTGMPQQGVPQGAGPGLPTDMQATPTDMGALQAQMQNGFRPGSMDMEHTAAMQAAATARAMEHQAVMEAFEQGEEENDLQQLGMLMQRMAARRGGGAPGAAPQPPSQFAAGFGPT